MAWSLGFKSESLGLMKGHKCACGNMRVPISEASMGP